MEISIFIMLLLLGGSSFQMVAAQATEANNNNPQPPVPVDEMNPTAAGGGGGSAPEVPVSNTEAAEEPEDSLTQCKTLCETGCANIPGDCQFVGDSIPVLCGEAQENCKDDCDVFCSCQYTCGCRVAEGCDDYCSQACKINKDEVIQALGQTTNAPEVEADNGGRGLKVVYTKVDSEENSEED